VKRQADDGVCRQAQGLQCNLEPAIISKQMVVCRLDWDQGAVHARADPGEGERGTGPDLAKREARERPLHVSALASREDAEVFKRGGFPSSSSASSRIRIRSIRISSNSNSDSIITISSTSTSTTTTTTTTTTSSICTPAPHHRQPCNTTVPAHGGTQLKTAISSLWCPVLVLGLRKRASPDWSDHATLHNRATV
jgi:hypothetical protein